MCSKKSTIQRSTCEGLKDICEMGSLRCSSVFSGNYGSQSNWGSSNFEDDMCQIDDKDLFVSSSIKYKSILSSTDLNKVYIDSLIVLFIVLNNTKNEHIFIFTRVSILCVNPLMTWMRAQSWEAI